VGLQPGAARTRPSARCRKRPSPPEEAAELTRLKERALAGENVHQHLELTVSGERRHYNENGRAAAGRPGRRSSG
jgi:hypothetical protein